MTIREILARRDAIRVEMRAIHDAHPETLPADQQTRWAALETEAANLNAQESRTAALDDLDRRVTGTPIAGGGSDSRFDTEIRRFSVLRAIAGAAGLPGVDAGREREISAEVARRSGRTFQGIAVPMAALSGPVESRVFSTTNPGGGPGSNLVATNLLADQFIDRLRASLVIRRLGATILSGLTGNVAIPRLKGSATSAWVAENSALTASDQQADQVSLSPKHAGGLTEFSRNMLLQSSPDVEQPVRADLAAILAQALDQAAIAGTGASNQPRGILNTSGIGAVALGTNGAALAYDNVVDLMGAVQNANAETASMAFLTNPKVRRAAQKLKTTTNEPLGEDVIFQSTPRAFTTNVPANLTKGTASGICSAMVYGDFSQLLIGLWSEIDILVNPYDSTAYARGGVLVRAMTTCDIAVRHPESFAAIHDILA